MASPDSQDDGFVFVDFDDETDVRSDVATASDNSSAALSEVSSSASPARFTTRGADSDAGQAPARSADSDAGQPPTPAPSIEVCVTDCMCHVWWEIESTVCVMCGGR